MFTPPKKGRSFAEILKEGPNSNPNYAALIDNEIYARVRNFYSDDQAELIEALPYCDAYLIANCLINSINALCSECSIHRSNGSSDEAILAKLRPKVDFLKTHLRRVKSTLGEGMCRKETQKFHCDVRDGYDRCINVAEELLKPLPSATPSIPTQIVTATPVRTSMWQSFVNLFYPAQNQPIQAQASRLTSPLVNAGIARSVRTPVTY